jgi:hypothetical protein
VKNAGATPPLHIIGAPSFHTATIGQTAFDWDVLQAFRPAPHGGPEGPHALKPKAL